MTKIDDIKFYRGPEASVPAAEEGEPLFTTDTHRLFVGSNSGNVEFARKDDLGTGVSESYTASDGQTVFNTTHAFTAGAGQTKVSIDGVPQPLGTSYTEVGTNEIVLSEGVPAGAIVTISLFELTSDLGSQVSSNTAQISNKADKTALGDITTLTTQNKTNVVAAINENVSSLADITSNRIPLYIEDYKSTRVAISQGWDYTQCFINAFADMKTTGKPLMLAYGASYYVTSQITATINNFKLIGNNATIYSLIPSGSNTFNLTGSFGNALPIQASINEGDLTFTLLPSDSSTLNVGDTLKISTIENYFVTSGRDYKKGEIVEVSSINTTTGVITIKGNGFGISYTQANNQLQAQKMNVIQNIEIRDLTFIGTGTTNLQAAFQITIAKRVNIKNIEIHDFETGVNLSSVIFGDVKNCYIHDCNNPNTGYGVAIESASKHINVHDNQLENNRHGFTTGGYDGVCMYVSVKGNHCKFHTNASLNTHGNARFVSFSGNTITHSLIGISSYSPYTTFKQNTIIRSKQSGIYTTEAGGINADVTGNEIINSGSDFFEAISISTTSTTQEINKYVKVDKNVINSCPNGAGILVSTVSPQRVTINDNDLYDIGYEAIKVTAGEQFQCHDNLIFLSRRSTYYAINITGTPAANLSADSTPYGSTASIKGNQIARYAYGISLNTIGTVILGDSILNVNSSYKYTLSSITTLIGGEVLRSPDGTLYKLSAANGGAISGVTA